VGHLQQQDMLGFLSKSISSLNQNKLNGLLAEVDFRTHLATLGFGARVSRGGWIARRVGANDFARNTAVFFPEIIQPGEDYSSSRRMPRADNGLHTICATFHQTGINAYFCAAVVPPESGEGVASWRAMQLGIPTEKEYEGFPDCVGHLFSVRKKRYNHLRYKTETNSIPREAIAEEFSKESLRVAFSNQYMAEISDVDGILWGQRHTYPLEIKEKTAAKSNKLGSYFGLDVGPFVKLAYYSARRGNLHSLFVVREIEEVTRRDLVEWWFITFEQLAQYASWVPMAGGRNMQGGSSSVVCIPKSEFQPLNLANLNAL
jgi:hypothetical protein